MNFNIRPWWIIFPESFKKYILLEVYYNEHLNSISNINMCWKIDYHVPHRLLTAYACKT